MLAALLNTPRTFEEWNMWSLHHRVSHDAIRDAIQNQKSINLPVYQIYPIPLDEPKWFLEQNQSAHEDMDGVLSITASNLQDIDLTNLRLLEAWVFLHYQEHRDAEERLGISS